MERKIYRHIFLGGRSSAKNRIGVDCDRNINPTVDGLIQSMTYLFRNNPEMPCSGKISILNTPYVPSNTILKLENSVRD